MTFKKRVRLLLKVVSHKKKRVVRKRNIPAQHFNEEKAIEQPNEAMAVEEVLDKELIGKETKKESLITKEYVVSLLKADNKRNTSLAKEKPIFRLCAAHAAIAYYIKLGLGDNPQERSQ